MIPDINTSWVPAEGTTSDIIYTKAIGKVQ
eukprot:SAG31_NODE_27455_length_425_cov_4.144172_1_plen_29_part_01